MNERVVEIIVYIVKEMRTNHQWNDGDNFKMLSQRLVDHGYSENEISYAFSWIFEKINSKASASPHSSKQKSHRILHEFEKIAISPAAYGYLIQLKEFDLIDNMEMEQIIEKAILMSTDEMVSLNEMKRLVSSTIFRPDDIMDGSFFLIDNSYNIH